LSPVFSRPTKKKALQVEKEKKKGEKKKTKFQYGIGSRENQGWLRVGAGEIDLRLFLQRSFGGPQNLFIGRRNLRKVNISIRRLGRRR